MSENPRTDVPIEENSPQAVKGAGLAPDDSAEESEKLEAGVAESMVVA